MKQLLAASLLLLIGFSFTLADEPAKAGVVAGQSLSQNNMFLRRADGSETWKTVKEKEEIKGGNLLIGLPGSTFLSKNGAVEVYFHGNVLGRSPLPVKEAVIHLPAAQASDLDFDLDRGQIRIVNKKAEGSARVVMNVHGHPWEITLEKPGTSITAELYGRWAPGVHFVVKPEANHAPMATLLLIVLSGEAQVKHDGIQRAMMAPPGPALLMWDNQGGADRAPQKLDRLPIWTQKANPDLPELVKFKEVRDKFLSQLETRPVTEVLDEMAFSKDPAECRFAITAMGAIDYLPGLGKVLEQAHTLDLWENCVLALRHWIGRKAGQDQILYDRLVNIRKMPEQKAETLVGLLHNFGEDDLAQKETYEVLVRYLNSEILGIRGLAHWHLTRLYPDGKSIGFDPLASKEERELAQKKWKQIIVDGKLPPVNKPATKTN